ncbi:hypothetical protein [Insolitispirillum peregrinum]|uniref:hypothetical protein n=1 Tax=Insolitispirillum peregrinum TaxID=80876 RepID=UPI00360FB910
MDTTQDIFLPALPAEQPTDEPVLVEQPPVEPEVAADLPSSDPLATSRPVPDADTDTAGADAFDRWSWDSVSAAPLPDPKASILAACTGVPYDYVRADLDEATRSAEEMVVARCFRALPVTATLFSDPALDLTQQPSLPAMVKAELAVGSLRAAQGGGSGFQLNAAANRLSLGAITGFSLAGAVNGNGPDVPLSIPEYGTLVHGALPEGGVGREILSAFQPQEEQKGIVVDDAASSAPAPAPAPAAARRNEYPMLDVMGNVNGVDFEDSMFNLLGIGFVNALEDHLRVELPKHNGNDRTSLRDGFRAALTQTLRDTPEMVDRLRHYPDRMVGDAAAWLSDLQRQKAQASAVVDSLHALTRHYQDGQLSPEFLEQAERTGGLQSLFIPTAMVKAMIEAGKLPPDVAGLVGDEDEDGATGHVSLGDVLDSAKTLSPDQQNVLFSIIQADENQNSLYAIDAAWSSQDTQRNYALLADAVMVRKDDYTYSAQRYFLDSIGGKGLGEAFVTFLASAPGRDYGTDPEALGGSPERLVSGPRQSIGMTQALDLAARAHDRGMAPDELGYREHHSSNQSRAIGEMFGADGSAPTLKTALPAYLMDLVEGLNDPDLTEEARARLDDAGHDLMGLLGLKPNTNVRTILSTMTPEQWERFGTGLQAFMDGTSATGAPGQPGEKVFADFARWMTLRTPEGARAFVEQNTVYARMSRTLGEWEDKYHISTRSAATLGLIAAVGQGAASVAGLSAGLAMTGTGVGALPGLGLLTLSAGGLASAIDTGQASLISLVTGDEHESLTDAAINAAAERMGIPPEAIMALEVGLGVAGMTRYGATATRAVLKAFRSGGEKLAATAFGQKALGMAADKAQGVVDFLSAPLKGFGGLDSRLQMAGGHGPHLGTPRSDGIDDITFENRASNNGRYNADGSKEKGKYGGKGKQEKRVIYAPYHRTQGKDFNPIDEINSNEITDSSIPDPNKLGEGGEKVVYELNTRVAVPDYENDRTTYFDFVVGVQKSEAEVGPKKWDPNKLSKEVGMLKEIKAFDLPVVEARGPFVIKKKVGVDEKGNAIFEDRKYVIYEKFEFGSKDIVKKNRSGHMDYVERKSGDIDYSQFLNERSVRDLERIKDIMESKKIRIHDLQFLIGKDGRVVIADPVKVITELKPSPTNIATLDLLIAKAPQNRR